MTSGVAASEPPQSSPPGAANTAGRPPLSPPVAHVFICHPFGRMDTCAVVGSSEYAHPDVVQHPLSAPDLDELRGHRMGDRHGPRWGRGRGGYAQDTCGDPAGRSGRRGTSAGPHIYAHG